MAICKFARQGSYLAQCSFGGKCPRQQLGAVGLDCSNPAISWLDQHEAGHTSEGEEMAEHLPLEAIAQAQRDSDPG